MLETPDDLLRLQALLDDSYARAGAGLVVTVHGTARQLDLEDADMDFRDFLVDHYGDSFAEWGAGNPYYGIEADWLFAADMSVHADA